MNIAALQSLVVPARLLSSARADWEAGARRHRAEKIRTARSNAVSRNRARCACVKARRSEWEAEMLHALRLPRSPLAFFLVRNFTPYIHRGRLLWLQLFKPFNRYPSTVFSCPC